MHQPTFLVCAISRQVVGLDGRSGYFILEWIIVLFMSSYMLLYTCKSLLSTLGSTVEVFQLSIKKLIAVPWRSMSKLKYIVIVQDTTLSLQRVKFLCEY